MSLFLGEFIGTMLLFIFGGGVVAGVILKGTKAENAGWIVITTGWGLAVTIAIYAVGSISGAHLNPAVTISLACVGEFAWEKVPVYVLAQLAGAFFGAIIVWLHYLPHWKETKDQGTQLAVFATGPAIRKTWANLLSEIIGAFILLFGLLTIGANKFSDGLNPLVIGGFIVAIGLSLGATTGYAINPARDLGPRLAHFILPIIGKGKSDWEYAWIPVIGPILGGILGALTYKALFKQEIYPLLWIFAPIVLILIILAIINERKENN
ncbi:MAG: MIP/aquaporin family protein [Bacteroidota bacterium]